MLPDKPSTDCFLYWTPVLSERLDMYIVRIRFSVLYHTMVLYVQMCPLSYLMTKDYFYVSIVHEYHFINAALLI